MNALNQLEKSNWMMLVRATRIQEWMLLTRFNHVGKSNFKCIMNQHFKLIDEYTLTKLSRFFLFSGCFTWKWDENESTKEFINFAGKLNDHSYSYLIKSFSLFYPKEVSANRFISIKRTLISIQIIWLNSGLNSKNRFPYFVSLSLFFLPWFLSGSFYFHSSTALPSFNWPSLANLLLTRSLALLTFEFESVGK